MLALQMEVCTLDNKLKTIPNFSCQRNITELY